MLLAKAPCPPLTRSPFPVRGRLVWWRLRRLFLLGRCPKVVFKSPVTPMIRGKESSHICGMRFFGSVPTCSGWGFSHIERFRPLRMTIREERMGSYLGDMLHVLELSVLYTIRVGPWRRGAPKAQDGSTKRCERLCEAIRLS